jgi:hypothetical protein
MEDLIDFTGEPQPRFSSLRLPPFWVDKPAAWFAFVESRFRLHNVEHEQARFDLLMSSLSKESVSQVIDIVEQPPAVQPYTVLKNRLLQAHQLTDYQRIELLLKLEPLGGRKPSELLSTMLELCPRGHETSIFFTHLFLQRLPAELRILLGEDDHQDCRALADKADKLWALHGNKTGLLAVIEQEEPAAVAAVVARGRRGGGRGRGGGVVSRGRGSGAAAAPITPPSNPVDLARIQSGLCFYHWSFGEKANKCTSPCNWGN